MEKEKFNKYKKTIETIFDILFFLMLIGFIYGFCSKILYLSGASSLDSFSNIELFQYFISCFMLFICTRLIHNGYFSAGIVGILVGTIEFNAASVFDIILGSFLSCFAISYLILYIKCKIKNDDKKKERKLIFIFIFLVILFVSGTIFFNFKENNKYNVSKGNILKINEFYANNFNVEVLSNPSSYSISNSLLDNGDYVRIELKIANTEKSKNKDVYIDVNDFSLLNENKEEIFTEHLLNCSNSDKIECLNGSIIKSGDSISGYLYFYDSLSSLNNHVTDLNKLSSIKYLKVTVNDSTNKKEYYLELK